ncbi:hypothetical protein ABZ570_07240 [Micromonospora sp. NPDC007271]|uniref:hypothetical protein n=1 Tax=Micromonospora sp. NPDC007271 TaxID=3154587 RepID=UPI0033EC18AD
MVTLPPADLRDHFAQHGYRRFDLLGEGMEGIVFALGDRHVGKLWFRRQPAELRIIKDFYEHLGSQDLPFAVPRIWRWRRRQEASPPAG